MEGNGEFVRGGSGRMGDMGGEDGEVYDMERSCMQGLAIGGIGELRQIGIEQGQRVRQVVERQAQAEGEARPRLSDVMSIPPSLDGRQDLDLEDRTSMDIPSRAGTYSSIPPGDNTRPYNTSLLAPYPPSPSPSSSSPVSPTQSPNQSIWSRTPPPPPHSPLLSTSTDTRSDLLTPRADVYTRPQFLKALPSPPRTPSPSPTTSSDSRYLEETTGSGHLQPSTSYTHHIPSSSSSSTSGSTILSNPINATESTTAHTQQSSTKHPSHCSSPSSSSSTLIDSSSSSTSSSSHSGFSTPSLSPTVPAINFGPWKGFWTSANNTPLIGVISPTPSDENGGRMRSSTMTLPFSVGTTTPRSVSPGGRKGKERLVESHSEAAPHPPSVKSNPSNWSTTMSLGDAIASSLRLRKRGKKHVNSVDFNAPHPPADETWEDSRGDRNRTPGLEWNQNRNRNRTHSKMSSVSSSSSSSSFISSSSFAEQHGQTRLRKKRGEHKIWKSEARRQGREVILFVLCVAGLFGMVVVAVCLAIRVFAWNDGRGRGPSVVSGDWLGGDRTLGHKSWNPLSRRRTRPHSPHAVTPPPSARSASSTHHRNSPSFSERIAPLPSAPSNVAVLDAPERDTLVIYRILGNDLPPRHQRGQTTRNLRFLLKEEWDWEGREETADSSGKNGRTWMKREKPKGIKKVEKYYVLNRLSGEMRDSMLSILINEYGVERSHILEIQFDWEEYSRMDWRWDGGVESPFVGWGVGRPSSLPPFDDEMTTEEFRMATECRDLTVSDDARLNEEIVQRRRRAESEGMGRLRALDYTFHEKNLYAINNNGGRNFALKHGRSLPHARWILPLDGNCFFTPSAMSSLVQDLSTSGEGSDPLKYVVIPMHRLLANEVVVPNNTFVSSSNSASFDLLAPHAPEEPQIGFRYNSKEEYQIEMRYGRRSKVELLWRLGAIAKERGYDKRFCPWEKSERTHLTSEAWGSVVESGQSRGGELARATGFIRAGWTYRLFSGDRSQEESNREALFLRNLNRIKGIIAFLEKLDEKVARGLNGCKGGGICDGFRRERLWAFDADRLSGMRAAYRARNEAVTVQVDALRDVALSVVDQVRRWMRRPDLRRDPQESARNATILALAGYLTSNVSLSSVASEYIKATFLRPFDGRTSSENREAQRTDMTMIGYGFPLPLWDDQPGWLRHMAVSLQEKGIQSIEQANPDVNYPYDPLSFDPTLLLDAIRLLSPSYQPSLAKSNAALEFSELQSLLAHHLHFLLFDPQALAISRTPADEETAIAYDEKVAALAAFLDDARLLARIGNRSRLRWLGVGGFEIVEKGRERLRRAFSRARLRPFDKVDQRVQGNGNGDGIWAEVLGTLNI